MSNNVSYSFISSDSDDLTFRSTVNSFGLDHVTDKDIVSFYSQFSQMAYTDTGLLPVDGSGLLSVRSAGPHTQIAYQHKPGFYYINWGAHEGDRDAVKYYVAQPYRIVIADLFNGNVLGARTFYSPISITYPEAPLYHVNLPNINCKGYRNNAVGWICLYHNEDISNYPFNEKLAKILDRCSGTEAYNDANMSETDGPRFYSENGKPSHLSNPTNWETYSQQNGYEWTLDPELWIPVLVESKDIQHKHDPNGQPLTFLDAITGNCKMYYYDENPVKPYNMISRPDLSLSSSLVFSWFKNSYNTSTTSFKNVNVFDASSNLRTEISLKQPQLFEEEEFSQCDSCGDDSDSLTQIYGESYYCHDCINEYTTYVPHMEQYVWHENVDLYYDEDHDEYYYLPEWSQYRTCDNCGYIHIYKHSFAQVNIWTTDNSDAPSTICSKCIPHHFSTTFEFEESSSHIVDKCNNCKIPVPTPSSSYSVYTLPIISEDGNNQLDQNGNQILAAYCNTCRYDHKIEVFNQQF